MSTEVAQETHCPDCGMEYKERVMDYYPPPQELRVKEVAESLAVAEAHRDFECPVQTEKDNVALLESLLRYFGISDTLAQFSKFVRENEHDGEIIWGNADRWFKREAARPLCCPSCDAALGVIEDGRLRIGAVIINPEDDGGAEVVCVACSAAVNLKIAAAPATQGEEAAAPRPRQSGAIGAPRQPLSLVQPTPTEQEQ